MSIAYRVDIDESIVWIEVAGEITAAEVERSVLGICADSSVPRGVAMLVDQTGLTEPPSASVVSITTALLQRLAHAHAIRRCATVAQDDATYGINRMIEVYAERTPITLRAFRDRAEAQAWLRRGD